MATRSASLRTRASPHGREHLGEGQIDRRRDLHGARIPLDDDDGTTGGFDQPGVIGGGPRLIGGAVGSQPMGGEESGDGEALRSLHRPQPSAIGSADDRLDRHIAGGGVPRVAAARPGDLLDGIRHGQGRDDCVMTGPDRRHDAAHDLGRSESASGVVHEDDEGVGRAAIAADRPRATLACRESGDPGTTSIAPQTPRALIPTTSSRKRSRCSAGEVTTT